MEACPPAQTPSTCVGEVGPSIRVFTRNAGLELG
jgi:hypothetical protein